MEEGWSGRGILASGIILIVCPLNRPLNHTAIIYTMVENCRLHGIDPLAYLTDVMPRLVDREQGADVSDLLPRQWKAAQSAG